MSGSRVGAGREIPSRSSTPTESAVGRSPERTADAIRSAAATAPEKLATAPTSSARSAAIAAITDGAAFGKTRINDQTESSRRATALSHAFALGDTTWRSGLEAVAASVVESAAELASAADAVAAAEGCDVSDGEDS